MRVLGIETSCDETSAAILDGVGDDASLRSLVILSQDVHRIFGGVVPEIASRAHLTSIVPVVERAFADAGVDMVDAVAVTNAPGLVGALLVGVSYAKAFAFARGVPVIGVHHMEGHLFATALEHRDAVPPFTALLVSGGHTMLLDVEAWGRYRLLGKTRDDAAVKRSTKWRSSSAFRILGVRTWSDLPQRVRAEISVLLDRWCDATKSPATPTFTMCHLVVSKQPSSPR
jgi:N6-L-threonylcarbamoyladenine synthase